MAEAEPICIGGVHGCIVRHDTFAVTHVMGPAGSDEISYAPPILGGKPLNKDSGRFKPPTPEELAKATLEPLYFEWICERTRAEEAVAAAIREDRARVMAVVNRARILIPAVFRDLDWKLGGRQ